MAERLIEIATKARQDLEGGAVNKELLTELYGGYNLKVGDVDSFIQTGLAMFPRLCCGIASVYLRHVLGEGEVVTGKYNGNLHTVLSVGGTLVDVTADQFGGPPVYVGDLKEPWKLEEGKN